MGKKSNSATNDLLSFQLHMLQHSALPLHLENHVLSHDIICMPVCVLKRELECECKSMFEIHCKLVKFMRAKTDSASTERRLRPRVHGMLKNYATKNIHIWLLLENTFSHPFL